MRIRQLLRRTAKPAALVGVVGLLSLSLIVTTPSNAYAFKAPLPVTPTFVMGAVKTVAPVAMAAVSLTPVGWGLRLLQLGILAYSTQDMWMPFVTGTFGAATGNADTPGTPGANVSMQPDVKLSSAFTTSGRTISGSWAYTGNQAGTGTMKITYRVVCREPSNGNLQTVSTTQGPFSYGNNGVYVGTAISVQCPFATQIPVSLIAGAANAAPELPAVQYMGPANVVRWGTAITGDAGFNPLGNDVGYVGKSECIDSAGTVSWVSSPEVPGDNGAMLMPSCEKAGKGHGTGRTKVEAFKPDGTTETVWDTGAQPLSDPATPLCDPGRATSGCTLDVLKDDAPCKSGDVECENWSEESQNDPTRWKCKLGPYSMPLSACNMLEKAFAPGGSPLNDENTDGNPSTSSPLGPSGQPAPAPAPVTTGTGTGTGGSPVPGGSGQTGPGATQQESACWPTGWGMLNPLEWVYKPVVCAAKALFEPQKNLQTRVTSMQGQFANKIPVSWFGVGVDGVSGGACPTNWAVSLNGQSYSLICGTEADGIIRGFRPVLGAMLVMAMLWPLIRSLFYAAIPVFKVTPS